MNTKTLNIRSQDRNNVSKGVFDPNINLANCNFNLNNPISLKEPGLVGVRSGFFPMTYKHIDSTNDRFSIKFLPAQDSADSACVFALFQIQHGYYNSTTAVKTEINRLLGLLDSTMATSFDDNLGGVINQFSAETDAILSSNMTCSLGTGDNDKDHLIISLPDGVVLNAEAHRAGDNARVGATNLVGGFQILFGDTGAGTVARGTVKGRSANKVLGFGDTISNPKTLGGNDFVGSPAVPLRGGSDAVQNVTSQFLASVLRTPYLYIRSSLAREAREMSKNGNATDLLAKIPVTSNTYGSTIFYEPHDASSLYFKMGSGDINNINITITDGDGIELDMEEGGDWELQITFKGNFYN